VYNIFFTKIIHDKLELMTYYFCHSLIRSKADRRLSFLRLYG